MYVLGCVKVVSHDSVCVGGHCYGTTMWKNYEDVNWYNFPLGLYKSHVHDHPHWAYDWRSGGGHCSAWRGV